MSQTFKEIAYQILKARGKPLSFQQITEIAQKNGLLKSAGKTPELTMGAQLYVDIRDNKNTVFAKLGKNRFGLKEWGIEAIEHEIVAEEKEKLKEIQRDRKRSIVGDRINLEGLRYAPLNENGVIYLFAKLQEKLGIIVEGIQATYPDAKGRRKTKKGWEEVWIEFEYYSSNFKQHGHDPKECDIIVRWEHDCEECPIDVIELRKYVI